MGLPARCDVAWFKNTFCSGNPEVETRGANDPVWDLVKSFNMYDSMALIAAIPIIRDNIFSPVTHDYKGTHHYIIGASKTENGVTPLQGKECISFLHFAYRVGITLDHHQRTLMIILITVQPETSDTFLGLALLRTLIEWEVMDCLGIIVSSDEPYIPLEDLETKTQVIHSLLVEIGLQAVPVRIQHASVRENQLEQLYKAAPSTGVQLLVVHGLTEAARFVMLSPDLFRKKTLSVVVLG